VQRRLDGVKIVEQADHSGKKLPRFGGLKGRQVAAADA
jgi:hypothetical protein